MASTKDITTRTTPTGVLQPSDVASLEKLFQGGFAEEKTISIGDPSVQGGSAKVPIFFGELIGDAGGISIQKMGSVPNPETGEVEMTDLPTYLFYPLDPVTFQPFKQQIYTVICSHQVAQACKKYLTLANAQNGKAQILFRWNGKITTRRGNMMNDVSVMHRIVSGPEKGASDGRDFTPDTKAT